MKVSVDHRFPGTSTPLHVDRMRSLIHPNAGRFLSRKSEEFAHIRQWLTNRFERLQLESTDYCELVLNPYNENGLGIQSVSVRIIRKKATLKKSVLMPDEWKDPTIGVIAPNIISSREYAVAEAQFSIEEGKAEELASFSDGLKMDGEKEGKIAALTRDGTLLVQGPQAVRTYLEMQNPSPDKIREVVNQGVYACRFVKT